MIKATALLLALTASSAWAELQLKARPNPIAVRLKDAKDDRVRMDFPEPTHIRDIARFVSLWSGKALIVDRNVDGKVQILAPEPLPRAEAWSRFTAALAQLDLVPIEVDGIVQILPASVAVPERTRHLAELVVPEGIRDRKDGPAIELPYTEPTDIWAIAADVAKWSGRRFVIDRNVNGKVQILTSGPMPAKRAYKIYLATLDQLGFTEFERGPAVQIREWRTAKHARELRLDAPPPAGGDVTLHVPDAIDIREVLAAARPWYGRDLVLDREVAGRIRILSPEPQSRQEAYETLVAALDLLGLTTLIDDGGAVRVLPYRTADGRL